MKLLRYLPRFQIAYREFNTLSDRETWSRDRINSFQLGRLNQVWHHAHTTVPYYVELFRQMDLPAQFTSIAEFKLRMPVLRKEPIRENHQNLYSRSSLPGWWTRTGGSTGAPITVYVGEAAHRESLVTKYRFQSMWGIDIFDRVAWIWGHSGSLAPGVAGVIDLVSTPLYDWLRGRLRLSAYKLSTDHLTEYLRRMTAFRPCAIYGYASAIQLLAKEARRQNVQYDSLRLCILTGEPATAEAIVEIESSFGVHAVIEYGSHECGFIAHSWRDRTLRVREDLVIAETVLRPDGRFDIVITNLNNPSFPLLRYVIEDITDKPIIEPERGFSVLENVAGRNNDLVVTRSGGHLHSSRFDALFKHECSGVRRFRVHQRADGAIAVSIELEEEVDAFDTGNTQQAIENLVEGFPVTIDIVREILPTSAGKHRFVVSDRATQSSSVATSSAQ